MDIGILPKKNVIEFHEIHILYIAKSPSKFHKIMRNLGEMFHTKYSSEWQLYQPVKICNRNVSTYWSDFPKNKDITVISDHEYGYILHYIEIALCILRLHLELAITFTNYNQMKHDISYEKYEISLKRNFAQSPFKYAKCLASETKDNSILHSKNLERIVLGNFFIEDFPMRKIKVFSRIYINPRWCYAGN